MSQQSPVPFGAGRVLRQLSGSESGSSSAQSTPGLFSLTYEPYYGLKEKPFSLSADPRFLFRSPAHAPAFEELLNGIRRREGLITLTGEIGTGKTTLIRSVLQDLDRRTFSAFVPDPFVSREDLLKMLLVDFGVVSIADLKRGSLSGASRPDLSYPLYEFLDSLVPLQAFAVLIIDEAQNLPLPLLEEIRILSDLEGREKLLQVVLVGQPELRSHLKLPEMRQVDQRVSVRCELTPLSRDGVAGYIAHRLGVAGEGQHSVEFSDAAIDAVYQGSKGTPRLINLICDRSLYRGFNARVERIEPGFVWDAMTDLGLEPAPALEIVAPGVADAVEPVQSHGAVAPAPDSAPSPEETTRQPARVDPQMLVDFAPENEPRVLRLRVPEQPPKRTGRKIAATAAIVALVSAAGVVGFLQAQSRAIDRASFTLPEPPDRPEPVFKPLPVPDEASLAEAAERSRAQDRVRVVDGRVAAPEPR